MRTIKEDIESINRFIDILYYTQTCITDIRIRINNHAFKTNEEILEEIDRAHNFLTDAEKYLNILFGRDGKNEL